MRLKTIWSFLPVAAALLACGDSAPTEPAFVGIYALQRVNGAGLPGILQATANDTVRAIGGSATIRSDETWAGELSLTITSGGFTVPSTSNGSGTYTRDGETVRFREASDGSVVIGTLRGATLNMTVEGVLMEFEKR